MKGRGYSVEDLVYRTPLSEPEPCEDMPEYVQKSLEQRGVNYNNMEVGKTSDNNWVLIKPGKANFGRAAPAHLAYNIVDSYLDFNSPEISYDSEEDIILLEHLGDMKTPQRSEYIPKDSLINALASKAIMGDPDISGNFGIKERKCCIYDFDQAGNTIRSVEESLKDCLKLINRSTSTDIRLKDIEKEAASMAERPDLEKLEEELEPLKDFYPDVDDAVKFRPSYITYNIEVAREEEIFNYEEAEPKPETRTVSSEGSQIFF